MGKIFCERALQRRERLTLTGNTMRPLIIHIFILAMFALLGLAVLLMEMLSTHGGGWIFSKYTFTKLYWLAFLVYALASSIVVGAVIVVGKNRQRPLTRKGVVLSHIILIGAVWVFIGLGLHDSIEDAWKDRSGNIQAPASQHQTDAAQQKRPLRATPPLKKERQYRPAGQAVEAQAHDNE